MHLTYPKLRRLKQKSLQNDSFYGICRKEKPDDGYFYDMENLSGEKFPVMSVKNPCAVRHGFTENAMGEKIYSDGTVSVAGRGITAAKNAGDNFCYCTDSHVFINGKRVIGALLDNTVSTRTIVPVGRNIFIVPDGEFITQDDSGFTTEHTNVSHFSETAAFSYCDEYGNTEDTGYGYHKSETPAEGDRYIEETQSGMMLYVYSENKWSPVGELFAKITSRGIGGMFMPGERIYVTDAFFDNGECVIRSVPDIDTVVVSGILYSDMPVFLNFRAEKKIPVMDFALEHNNRVWGCRYGKNNNGNFVNEIYACALGDPRQWETFEGISTDSYTVSLGCPGEFTGAMVLGSDILFFKEEYIIRISGEAPSDFSVTAVATRGVQRGCHNSIVNINDRLFYKSRYGVMMYDGTFPVEISEYLGNERYEDAVAQGIDNKYYIAMTDSAGKRNMFIFHLNTAQWYKEDDRHNTRFIVRIRNCLYYVCLEEEADNEKKYSFRLYDAAFVSQATDILGDEAASSSYIPDESVSWYAETGVTGEDFLPSRQILRRIHITLRLTKGAALSVYIRPDNEQCWKRLCYIDTPVNKVFTLPVTTPPCHSYRLRFEGKGQCQITGLVRQSEINPEVKNIG